MKPVLIVWCSRSKIHDLFRSTYFTCYRITFVFKLGKILHRKFTFQPVFDNFVFFMLFRPFTWIDRFVVLNHFVLHRNQNTTLPYLYQICWHTAKQKKREIFARIAMDRMLNVNIRLKSHSKTLLLLFRCCSLFGFWNVSINK